MMNHISVGYASKFCYISFVILETTKICLKIIPTFFLATSTTSRTVRLVGNDLKYVYCHRASSWSQEMEIEPHLRAIFP